MQNKVTDDLFAPQPVNKNNIGIKSLLLQYVWSLTVSSPPQLVNINEGYMSLMSDNGDIREDLRVPDNDIGKEIESKFEAGDEFMVSVNGSFWTHSTDMPDY